MQIIKRKNSELEKLQTYYETLGAQYRVSE